MSAVCGYTHVDPAAVLMVKLDGDDDGLTAIQPLPAPVLAPVIVAVKFPLYPVSVTMNAADVRATISYRFVKLV